MKSLISHYARTSLLTGYFLCAFPCCIAMQGCSGTSSGDTGRTAPVQADTVRSDLGGLSPEEALEYMKKTPNLYIIDVREPEWYEGFTQFTGNHHIPVSQLGKRYKEIPSDRPVLINCGAGVMAPKAYKILKDKKADIKQLSYIAGTPLFEEYNTWVKHRK